MRTLRDRQATEDVQQQVFAEVWRRGADYDPSRAGLLTWIMQITRSRAIDYLRKRVPEPVDPTDKNSTDIASDDESLTKLHEAWLMDPEKGLVSIGGFKVGDVGKAEIDVPVPVNPDTFPVIDISLEPADGAPAHSGKSVLRADLS